MLDDNKELVEVMLTSYNKYADKIGAPHGYIACMEAALSIIQSELARKDKIIDAYERGVAMINNAVSDAQSIIDLRKLKTTTGHDNNTEKRGKR